jgi:hypothetical protein
MILGELKNNKRGERFKLIQTSRVNLVEGSQPTKQNQCQSRLSYYSLHSTRVLDVVVDRISHTKTILNRLHCHIHAPNFASPQEF